jgi:pyruvate dehydrogenase E1 component alpha subunit
MWKAKDPIPRFSRRMLKAGMASEEELKKIDEQIKQQVQDAVEFAKQSPYPAADEVTDHVYV